MTFGTQYQLTTSGSPTTGGTVAGGGWYDSGSTATVTATPGPNFQFSSFSGDLAGITNPQSLVMNAAKTVTANFVPLSAATSTALVALPNPATFGQSVTITATVSATTGSPVGSVTFYDGATALGTAPLSGSQASLAISSLSVGAHSLTATYGGNASFLASSSAPFALTVARATSTTNLGLSPSTSVFGEAVTLTAAVAPQFGGAATGTVTFLDGATPLATVGVTSNQAVTVINTFGAGTHILTAAYSGDTNVSASTSGPVSLGVSKASTSTQLSSSANPAFVNQPVTITATVKSQYGGILTGTVTFRSGLGFLGVATLTNGVASFTTTYTTTGSRNISGIYSGDANDSGSISAILSQSVTKVPTSTTLATSGTPSFIGQSVTFTATVTSVEGAPKDGDAVTFRDRGTTIGTGTTTGGVALLTTSALVAGSHSITASYGGDSVFAASTSRTLAQVVSKYATATAVTASPTSSIYGQVVALTATVPVAAGSPGATGTVTFRSGASTLATVALSGGTAAFTTSSLTVGTKSITAVYGGDTNNAASTSPILAFTVTKAPTTVLLTSTPNPSTTGQTVTLTATVTSTAGIPTGTVIFRTRNYGRRYLNVECIGSGHRDHFNSAEGQSLSDSQLLWLDKFCGKFWVNRPDGELNFSTRPGSDDR